MSYPGELKDKAKELHSSGMKTKEIAGQLGISYQTVWNWLNKVYVQKEKKDKPDKKVPVKDNSDRHLCKTCRFRGDATGKNGCDYIEIVGHSRGCSVEECNVYERGKREKRTERPTMK